ncbi:MAG: hypothetical protein GOV15_02880, partial [Candidatus Diapherotrites archaeon]|nr:hypothetical protein [Candidatus Diapherotrites archaeon]
DLITAYGLNAAGSIEAKEATSALAVFGQAFASAHSSLLTAGDAESFDKLFDFLMLKKETFFDTDKNNPEDFLSGEHPYVVLKDRLELLALPFNIVLQFPATAESTATVDEKALVWQRAIHFLPELESFNSYFKSSQDSKQEGLEFSESILNGISEFKPSLQKPAFKAILDFMKESKSWKSWNSEEIESVARAVVRVVKGSAHRDRQGPLFGDNQVEYMKVAFGNLKKGKRSSSSDPLSRRLNLFESLSFFTGKDFSMINAYEPLIVNDDFEEHSKLLNKVGDLLKNFQSVGVLDAVFDTLSGTFHSDSKSLDVLNASRSERIASANRLADALLKSAEFGTSWPEQLADMVGYLRRDTVLSHDRGELFSFVDGFLSFLESHPDLHGGGNFTDFVEKWGRQPGTESVSMEKLVVTADETLYHSFINACKHNPNIWGKDPLGLVNDLYDVLKAANIGAADRPRLTVAGENSVDQVLGIDFTSFRNELLSMDGGAEHVEALKQFLVKDLDKPMTHLDKIKLFGTRLGLLHEISSVFETDEAKGLSRSLILKRLLPLFDEFQEIISKGSFDVRALSEGNVLDVRPPEFVDSLGKVLVESSQFFAWRDGVYSDDEEVLARNADVVFASVKGLLNFAKDPEVTKLTEVHMDWFREGRQFVDSALKVFNDVTPENQEVKIASYVFLLNERELFKKMYRI